MNVDKEKIEDAVIMQLSFAIPRPKTIEEACRLAVQLTIDILQEDYSFGKLSAQKENNGTKA